MIYIIADEDEKYKFIDRKESSYTTISQMNKHYKHDQLR